MEVRKYRDRAEYLKKAVSLRRERLKTFAVDYKGGKCERCGYNKCTRALNFHHLDPKTKSFSIGTQGYTRSLAVIKNELDKCILLCANCHMEIHTNSEHLKILYEQNQISNHT